MSQYLLQFFKGLLQNFAVPQYRNTYLQMSDNLVICFVFHILYCTLLYCIEIICFTLKDPHYFFLVWYGMVESELFCRYCMVEFELYGGIVWQSYCMVPLYGSSIIRIVWLVLYGRVRIALLVEPISDWTGVVLLSSVGQLSIIDALPFYVL